MVAAVSFVWHDKPWDAVRYSHERDREDEQDSRGGPGHSTPPWKGLLERDQRRNERSPRKAHHSEREERSHQRPAAAQAPGAMSGAHFQGAPRPLTPCA